MTLLRFACHLAILEAYLIAIDELESTRINRSKFDSKQLDP